MRIEQQQKTWDRNVWKQYQYRSSQKERELMMDWM